jgi:ERCC4-type nuclease
MVIIVDTREKPRAIVKILAEFDRQGVKVVRRALNFADYFNPGRPDVIIDRKQNLLEIAGNVIQGRARFMREVERCNRAGCHMIVLIEHSSLIHSLEDVISWKNPRLKVSPLAVSGDRLFRIMKAMEIKYGIEWQFCSKQQTGKTINELLRSDQDAE